MASLSRPVVTSLREGEMASFSEYGQYLRHGFSYLTVDDEAWYTEIVKKDAEDFPTLNEINQSLYHVEDSLIFPEKPASIKVAAPELQNVHIKRPHFKSHSEHDPEFWSRAILHEASIMEQITTHPNIITYYGCRVHRGRITGIVLELLGKTLMESPHVSDIPAFLAELQSAVDHLHSTGLAHNDINPYNIMIKDGHPILIDFGGCAPPGHRVSFCGTPGWCEKGFFYSEYEHDTYGMNKVRTWLENGGKEDEEQLQQQQRQRGGK